MDEGAAAGAEGLEALWCCCCCCWSCDDGEDEDVAVAVAVVVAVGTILLGSFAEADECGLGAGGGDEDL